MNLIRAILLFSVATALLAFCAAITIMGEGFAEIVFGNIALYGAGIVVALAWGEFVEEGCRLIDETIPAQLTRARSSRRRWLRVLAGGSTALSYGA